MWYTETVNVSLLPSQDTEHLDSILLDESGFCRPLPAAELRRIGRDQFRIWCARNAVYAYPSLELVEWLRELIAGRPAIEVGAGNGHLGRSLGIPMTDSGMQLMPAVADHYRALGQAPTNPPDCVELLGAEEAVAKYRPQVVVASWLTHRWRPGMSEGNEMGPEEENIVQACEAYVHVGNDGVHRQKPIWALEHRKEYHDWLVSRASNEDLSHVAVWGS